MGQGYVFLIFLQFSSVTIILTVFPTVLHYVPTDSVESSQPTALLKGTLLSVFDTQLHALYTVSCPILQFIVRIVSASPVSARAGCILV